MTQLEEAEVWLEIKDEPTKLPLSIKHAVGPFYRVEDTVHPVSQFSSVPMMRIHNRTGISLSSVYILYPMYYVLCLYVHLFIGVCIYVCIPHSNPKSIYT